MSTKILVGDCRDVLAAIPDESVHCCVSSPPYFGLRDYGVAGQIGLEPSPDAFVAELVAVFREVRRVLRADGTLWLNLGDSYAGYHGNRNSSIPTSATNGWTNGTNENARTSTANRNGLKSKDLIGIPWRVAFALQQPYYTGKIKRLEDRIWLAAIVDGEGCFFIHKRKAGTSAYTKFVRADGSEASYLRTADTYGAGIEICNTSKALIDRVAEIVPGGTFTTQGPEQNVRRKQTIYRWRLSPNETKLLAQELYPHLVAKQHQARLIFSCPSNGDAGAASHQAMMDLHNGAGTSINFPAPPSLFEQGYYLRQDIIWGKPNPMPESVTDRCTKAHEYLFLLSKSPQYFFDAPAIAEQSITGDMRRPYGSPGANALDPRGKQGEGKPRSEKQRGHERRHAGFNDRWDAMEKAEQCSGTRNKRSVWTVATQPFSEAHFATFPPALIEPCILAGCPKGGTVLDPFGGAGTTGVVADRLGRDAILIELNPEYAGIAERRMKSDGGMFCDVSVDTPPELTCC